MVATAGPATAADVSPPKYVHALCDNLVGWVMDMAVPTSAVKNATTATSAADIKAQSITAWASAVELTDALTKRLTALGTPKVTGGRKFAAFWVDYLTFQRDSFSKTRDSITALASTDTSAFKQQLSALLTTQQGELATAIETWKSKARVVVHGAPSLNTVYKKDKACQTLAALGIT